MRKPLSLDFNYSVLLHPSSSGYIIILLDKTGLMDSASCCIIGKVRKGLVVMTIASLSACFQLLPLLENEFELKMLNLCNSNN